MARLLAVFALGSIAIVGTASPAQADPNCIQGVYILFARGSSAGFDSNEAAVLKEMVQGGLSHTLIPSVWAELGNLDANGIIDPNWEYPAVGGEDWFGDPGYVYSVGMGREELIRHLNDRYAGNGPRGHGACAREVVVLSGYSQGADVIGDALVDQDLNPAVLEHIAFVANFGDPTHSNGGIGGCVPYEQWARGDAGCVISNVPIPPRSPYARAGLEDRTGSWCDQADGLCSHQLWALPGSHPNAYWSHWIPQATPEIVAAARNRLALLNPPQGTGVGNAGYLGSDRLYANQIMYPNSYIMSPDGNFVLILQQDGNLVLYGPRYQPIWQTGTAGQAVGSVIMQPDGNLVLYSPSGLPVWYNGINGVPGAQLRVQADGNLVEYNAANQAVWHTNSSRPMETLSYAGGDSLNIGQTLGQNQFLRSADGTKFLLLQTDGNLVLYGPGRRLLWHTGTGATGGNVLAMQGDGNLVLYKPNAVSIWHTRMSGANGGSLTLQSDGNLVQYPPSALMPVWQSGTGGKI